MARTVIFTGRPMRVRKTPYVENWYERVASMPIKRLTFFTSRENNRQAEIKELTSRGIIPAHDDLEKHPEKSIEAR